MADVYLAVQSAKPGSSLIVLIDAEPSTTGYKIDRAGGVDLGAPSFDKTYSGPRGTQGAVLVGATAQNRLSTWTLQAVGTSEDDLHSKLSTLWNLDEELRRYGGTAYWRSWGSSFRMQLEVLDSNIATAGFDPDLWPKLHIMKVAFGLVTPPYMSGPPMEILDDFSSNTLGNYTFDTGSSSDVVISGGQLTVTANPTTEKRMIHTAVGYSYGDVQATVKATPGSTITSFLAGVVLKRIDASNYLRVYVDDNGTNSRLRIDKVVAGVTTNLATTNLAARVVNGTAFWVRGRIEGVNVFAEHFAAAPSPMATPTTATSYTLSTAEQTTFGETVTGQVGIVWVPQQSAAVLDDFDVDAYTYTGRTLPEETIRLNGAIPGDAPALADVEITPSGGAAAPIWAALGWWPKVGVWNRVWNGDFENTLLAANGWGIAAVANINGATTSFARITTAAKYGTCSGQIVTPATQFAGANFRIFRRFRKGVTYTVECWIHSAAQTTPTVIRIGNSAANDLGSSGSTNLSTSWQRISATWTPTADRDEAHLAVLINAATATTFEIDGVMVYEGTVAPTSVNQSEGRGGFPPVGVIEAENDSGAPTILASANYRSGSAISYAAAGGAGVLVDTALIVPDDFAGTSVAIEVWARCELTAGSAVSLAVQAQPISSLIALPSLYAEEFGAAGKSLTLPSAGTVRRLVRLGTLRLETTARYLLKAQALVGTAVVDYFLLLPNSSRALSPSGRANDTSFPPFASVTSEITRRIRSDLSGAWREPGSGEVSAPGLGGSLLEPQSGNLEAVVKLSSLVPDNPTVDTTTEQLTHSATVHFPITPRWRVGRSS